MTLDGPLIDALLEHGITDKQLTFVKNLDAVEYLLETLHDTHEYECIGCGADNFYGRRDAHMRDCKVMLARIAIGLHTLEAELEAAEDEARREHARRSAVPRRSAYSMEQANAALRGAFAPERFERALYADNPLLSMLRDRPPTALPRGALSCPHCNSTSLTPLPNSQMLTCDACQRTSAAERCAS